MINQPDELIELLRKQYTCPISGHPIQKPFIDAEGNSFEFSEIENHFSLSSTSPVTGNQIGSKVLTENFMLQNLIQRVEIQIPKISLQILSLKGQIHRLQLQNERMTHQNEHFMDQESKDQKKEPQQNDHIFAEKSSKRKQIRKQNFKKYYVGEVGKLFQKRTKHMQRVKEQFQQGCKKQMQKLKMEKFKKQRQIIILSEKLKQKDEMIKELEKKLSVSSSRFESQIAQYEELILELAIHRSREKQQYDIKDVPINSYQQVNSPQQTSKNQQLIHLILSRHGVDINSTNKLQTRKQLTQKLHHFSISYLDANNRLEFNTNQHSQQQFELKNQLRKAKQEVFTMKKAFTQDQKQSNRREEVLKKQVEILQKHLKKMHSSWMLIVYAIEEFSSLSKQYHEESLTSKIICMINQIKEQISTEILTERLKLQRIFHFTTQTMKKIKALYKIQSYCQIWDFIDLYTGCDIIQTTNPQQSPAIIGYSLDFQSLVKILDKSLAKGIEWTDILQLKSQSMGINDENWKTLIKHADQFSNLVSISFANNSIKNVNKKDFENFPHLQKINLKHDKSTPWSFDSIRQIRNYKNDHKHVRFIH